MPDENRCPVCGGDGIHEGCPECPPCPPLMPSATSGGQVLKSGLPSLGVVCGRCGGPVYMVTCNSFSGSGHEWVIVSVCRSCRLTNWIEEACHDCRDEGERMEVGDA